MSARCCECVKKHCLNSDLATGARHVHLNIYLFEDVNALADLFPSVQQFKWVLNGLNVPHTSWLLCQPSALSPLESRVRWLYISLFFPPLHLNGFPGLSWGALFLLLLILSFLPFIVPFFPSSCFFIFHVSHFVSIVLSPLHLAYFNAILVFVPLQADRHLQTTFNHPVSLHLCIV